MIKKKKTLADIGKKWYILNEESDLKKKKERGKNEKIT